MKTRLTCLILVATTGLAACGGATSPAPASPKPEPVAEAPAQPAAAAPQAQPVAPQPAEPAPAPAMPVTGLQRYALGEAVALIPADAIGGSPVMNRDDAWARGTEAVNKYCADNGMTCEGFYAKERPVEQGGFWTVRYYGRANGEGTFIGVRVYPDGRAEIVR